MDRIALTLSGGGYRAAAFHLGTLSYLHKAGLLEKVKVLSTVSGGTITGATYALSAKCKTPFEEYFRTLYSFLKNVDLVKLSLERIGDRSPHSALGFRDLITSFAELYEEKLVPKMQFGIFSEGKPCHLEEIIFNATEFRTGLPFRFLRSENGRPKIGNGNVWIPLKVARMIRIADIIAASSCFPGGFEPLAFPQDFRWPNDVIPPELSEMSDPPLCLMDGGIYDNQGIESALAAADRMKRRPDCFIISDTEPPSMMSYRYKVPASFSTLTLSTVDRLAKLFIGLGTASAFVLLAEMALSTQKEGISVRGVFSGLIPAIVMLSAVICVLWILIRTKRDVLDRVPKAGGRSWADFRKLSVNQAIAMIELRATSLYSLASQVFTRRIRRVVYQKIFEDSRYTDRRISNLIFDLTPGKARTSRVGLRPSALLQEIAQESTDMPTTLWFEHEAQLRMLVACGQFTMCYNILEFIVRKHGNMTERYPKSIQALFTGTQDDWRNFLREPFMMLDS